VFSGFWLHSGNTREQYAKCNFFFDPLWHDDSGVCDPVVLLRPLHPHNTDIPLLLPVTPSSSLSFSSSQQAAPSGPARGRGDATSPHCCIAIHRRSNPPPCPHLTSSMPNGNQLPPTTTNPNSVAAAHSKPLPRTAPMLCDHCFLLHLRPSNPNPPPPPI
jgi:hypothetical protein